MRPAQTVGPRGLGVAGVVVVRPAVLVVALADAAYLPAMATEATPSPAPSAPRPPVLGARTPRLTVPETKDAPAPAVVLLAVRRPPSLFRRKTASSGVAVGVPTTAIRLEDALGAPVETPLLRVRPGLLEGVLAVPALPRRTVPGLPMAMAKTKLV